MHQDKYIKATGATYRPTGAITCWAHTY